MSFRLSLAVIGVLALAPTARALPLRQGEITRTCAPDIERFCPELSGLDEPRNQRICLKPYLTSLALPCRKLLRALH